jgi:hypothetical protein
MAARGLERLEAAMSSYSPPMVTGGQTRPILTSVTLSWSMETASLREHGMMVLDSALSIVCPQVVARP